MRENITCFGKVYSQNKKKLNFAPRDDYCKIVGFLSDSTYYRLSSSIYDKNDLTGDLTLSTEMLPKKGKMTRTDVIYSATKISRNKEDDMIHLEVVTDIDCKVNVPRLILLPLLKSHTKAHYDIIVKYYSKNYKKL